MPPSVEFDEGSPSTLFQFKMFRCALCKRDVYFSDALLKAFPIYPVVMMRWECTLLTFWDVFSQEVIGLDAERSEQHKGGDRRNVTHRSILFLPKLTVIMST